MVFLGNGLPTKKQRSLILTHTLQVVKKSDKPNSKNPLISLCLIKLWYAKLKYSMLLFGSLCLARLLPSL
jgi:hypothetical protein